jgi:hypothetical protein
VAKTTELLIPAERIERAILLIRGEEVLLDRDLAELYGVGTRVLVQAVKRNLRRFPADFMFQLSKEEFENWRSQFVMSNPGSKMGLRRWPYAFTEQGITNTIVPGQLDIFSNVAGGQFTHRPNTILALPNGTTATLESFPIEYAEVYGVPVA